MCSDANVTIYGAGKTLADAAVSVAATVGSTLILSVIDTNEMLQELRQRYITQEPALVVKIVPFDTTAAKKKLFGAPKKQRKK